MSKQKTAIDQLIDFNNENSHLEPYVLCMLLRGKMEELKPVIKQQIIDAVNYGENEHLDFGEQYFNKTFN